MTKPTIQEVAAYLIEKKEYSQTAAKVFADRFWNYYESVGWIVGKGKAMKSWTAAISTWELKNKDNAHQGDSKNGAKPGTSEARIKTAREW